MQTGGTFLTSVGVEFDVGLAKYSVDNGTSQSTLLLQKKKKMQEVQDELDRKKQEYEIRMRKCKEKEDELREKQEKIRESVVRFEKFVKENDMKRARALKKERDEVASRRQKESEIEALRVKLAEHTERKAEFRRLLAKLSASERYLEGVLESSDEFQELPDILMRHATLTASNQDLRRVVDDGNAQAEELRSVLSSYTKEKEDQVLVQTSAVAGYQKAAETMKSDNVKLDQAQQYRESLSNDRTRALGEAKMALANIYVRCRKPTQPGVDASDIERVVEYVAQRLADLGDVAQAGLSAGVAKHATLGQR